jgi:DNA-binding transcriptional regulator YiaG
MPNVTKVLRDEISRISRKEAKAAVAPIRKPSVRYRKDIADLKRRMALQEQATKQVQALLKKLGAALPAPTAPEADQKARITAKGMRSLRRKLRLSGDEFAKLLGVTSQNIYHWEKREGALRVRASTRAAILSIRGLAAREVRQRLEEMKAKEPKKAKGAASKRGKANRRRK